MMRMLFICLIIAHVSACESDEVRNPLASAYEQVFIKPHPWGLGETPEGSPIFKKGWEEGCNTGLGVYGGKHYRKEAYKFQQDLSLVNNPEYYRAWKDAYSYCRWYIGSWTRDPNGYKIFW